MAKYITRSSWRLALGAGLLSLPCAAWGQSEPRPLDAPSQASEPAPLDSTDSVDATPVAPPAARTPAVASPVAPLGPISDKSSDKSSEKTAPGDSILNKTMSEVIRERNANGSVKVERHVIQDEDGNYSNHGGWTQWDDKGQIVGTGEYVNGKRQGKWVRWYGPQESGSFAGPIYKDFQPPFAAEANFENGVLNGAWRIFDSKNHKMCEWNFQDGQRHGKSTWWYISGQKRKEIEYAANQLDGEVTEYQADGKVLSRERYMSGRKLVLQVEFFDSKKEGQKKSEGWVLTPRDLTKHNYDWWNGVAVINVLGREGEVQKHGTWTWWHANGQRQMEGRYEENQPVGKFSWWYPNGQKQLEGEYVTGRQTGRFTWWHMNGQKQCEGQYAVGEQTGKWLRWSAEGKVVEAGDYSTDHHGELVKAPAAVTPLTELEATDATHVAERQNAEPKKLRR